MKFSEIITDQRKLAKKIQNFQQIISSITSSKGNSNWKYISVHKARLYKKFQKYFNTKGEIYIKTF